MALTLRKAVKASDVYFRDSRLEKLCIHDHEFCKTGMVQHETWDFPYRWDGAEPAEVAPLPLASVLEPEAGFQPQEIDPFYQQEMLEGF